MPSQSELNRIQSRIVTLRDLHRRYDEAADEESRRRLPDEVRLKQLKRARLAVKDEMGTLERRLGDLRFAGRRELTTQQVL